MKETILDQFGVVLVDPLKLECSEEMPGGFVSLEVPPDMLGWDLTEYRVRSVCNPLKLKFTYFLVKTDQELEMLIKKRDFPKDARIYGFVFNGGVALAVGMLEWNPHKLENLLDYTPLVSLYATFKKKAPYWIEHCRADVSVILGLLETFALRSAKFKLMPTAHLQNIMELCAAWLKEQYPAKTDNKTE